MLNEMSNSTECSNWQLSVGQRLCVRRNKPGTLRYLGNVYFAKGLWCGIELDEAVGENDGMINSIRYFTCKNNFGLFVPVSEIFHVSNASNVEESHSNVSASKLLKNSTINRSSNLEFQKNVQNLYTLKKQPVLPEKSQSALNESYTISNDFHVKNSLSVIVEENIKFPDSFNISHAFNRSTLNTCKNSVSNDQTFLYQDKSCSTSRNKIIESCCQGKNEYDLADSDESLGILPSSLLEDSHFDDLMPYVDIKNVNLNTTVNLANNMDIELGGCETVMSDFNLDEVFSPIYHTSNASLLCNQNAESPVQSNIVLPKYASTPKHETNFSDVSNEIENALNLTHNLSSEFQMNHTLFENENQNQDKKHCTSSSEKNALDLTHNVSSEFRMNDTLLENENKDEKHSTSSFEVPVYASERRISSKILNESAKSLNVSQDLENIAENCLNVTFHKDLDQNSSVFYSKPKIESKTCVNNYQEDPILNQNAEEILNTTYDKELKFSVLKDSKSQQSTAIKGNMKYSRCPIKNRDTKSKIHFSNANISLTKTDTKNKFDRNKLRKSVSCVGSVSALKSDTTEKQVRRNSTSGNFSTSSKENFPKVKVSKFSSLNLSNKHVVKQSCITNLVSNQESSVDASIVIKSVNKNILKSLTLNSESSKYKSKIKTHPKDVFQINQERVLNETINLAPHVNEIGKTVVKKPRSSMNFACFKKTSFQDCDTILSGNTNEVTYNKKIIPSKSGRTLGPIEMHYKINDKLNETTLIDKTTKKPFNAVAFNNRKSKIARLSEKHLSSEKNCSSTLPSFGMNHNDLNRNCHIMPYVKPVCINKIAGSHASSSRKSLASKFDVINSCDTVVSDRKSCKTTNEGFKTVYMNRKGAHNAGESSCNLSKPHKNVNLNNTILLPDQQSNSKQTIEVLKRTNKRSSCIPLSKIPSIQGCNLGSHVKSSNAIQSSVSQSVRKQDEKEKPSHRMILRKRVSVIPRIESSPV